MSNLLTFTEECEIYKVKVPERYSGCTFMEASLGMLQDEHVTLIGIEKETLDVCGDAKRRVITTPTCSQPLDRGDNAFVIAVSFSQGFESAD